MKKIFGILVGLICLAMNISALTLNISAVTTNTMTLSWNSSVSNRYSLQASSTMTEWREITNITAVSTLTKITVPTTALREFYKLSNQLPVVYIELNLTNGSVLSGIIPINFTAIAQGADIVYGIVRVWTNGGKTNVIDTLDLHHNPTNTFQLDTTGLYSKIPHFLQMEVCDSFGNKLTGENARWALSEPVLFTPTNAIALMHPLVVGWKFAADIITSGVWSCVISNEWVYKQWSGITTNSRPLNIRDAITDFTHSYPGNDMTVHVVVRSGNRTNRLVRSIPVDRRPLQSESLVIEDARQFTTTNTFYPNLWVTLKNYLDEFTFLGANAFNVTNMVHDDAPYYWNTITGQPELWTTVKNYIHGDYGQTPNRVCIWSPGYGPLIGDESNHISVAFLKTVAPSNRLTFAVINGCNSSLTRDLVWPDKMERSELFEWGLNPRLGFSWKGYPLSLGSPEDISVLNRVFWRKFKATWFEKDIFGFGINMATSALESARTLDDGTTPNPLVQYLEVTGSTDIYCDEVTLTDF